MKGLEKYENIKSLGEGAQGTVVLARDSMLGRRVAIKSLHPSLLEDPLHVQRFEEEAKTLAGLEHPFIVTVYEYVANSSGCHLMMEYFEGHPLDNYIRNISGPIPEATAIDIFIKVLDAMSYIHKKKIIHRDIKPSNIMINDLSEIRLLDFGIAKNTENDLTLTKIGSSAGYTPMYMSPEHCNGNTISKYSDIYSLGVTLWQMVTGKAPYEGFTQGQIYMKVANDPLPSIQSMYPKVPEVSLRMNEVIQKATNKASEKRYQSCDTFKKDLMLLKEHLKDLPTIFIQNKTVVDPVPDPEQTIGTLQNVVNKMRQTVVPPIKNIGPNLALLFNYLKHGFHWAVNSALLIRHKANPESINTIDGKISATRSAIKTTQRSIVLQKKEYAAYILLLALFFTSSYIFKIYVATAPMALETKIEAFVAPTIDFETSESAIPESETGVFIPVVLSTPSDSIIKIPLEFSGTAIRGIDYDVLTDTIVVNAKETFGYVRLTIKDDVVIEDDETIQIEFGQPINAKTGSKVLYTYTISNDDEKTPTKKKKPTNKNPSSPSFTKKGVIKDQKCIEGSLYQYYHDGKGGAYKGELLARNSKDCGFVKPRNNYLDVIKGHPHDRHTSPNSDGYFITIADSGGKKCVLTIWNTNSGLALHSYDILGKIDNISYANHKFYTNNNKTLDHHIIDIINVDKSYLGTNNIFEKRLNFQYQGSPEENKLIEN